MLAVILAAFLTSTIGFGWLLPRLPGISETGKRLGLFVLCALHAGVVSAIVICIGMLTLFGAIWVGLGGGGAKGMDTWFAFQTIIALGILFGTTLVFVLVSSKLGFFNLDKPSRAVTGTLAIMCLQVPVCAGLTYAAMKLTEHRIQYGYINKAGEFVIPARYRDAGSFKNGIARVELQDGRVEFINTSGQAVAAPADQSPYSNVRSEPKSSLDDRAEDYEDEGSSSAGRYLVTHGNLQMLPFSENLALARKTSQYRWGFVDRSFKFVIPEESFDDGRHFQHGLAPVATEVKESPEAVQGPRRWGYIDRAGRWVIKPAFQSASCFTEGLGCVSVPGPNGNDERYGYVDKAGRLVIPTKFAYAKPFSEGLAAVWP